MAKRDYYEEMPMPRRSNVHTENLQKNIIRI